MDAGAAQDLALSVYKKALFQVELQAADAKGDLLVVRSESEAGRVEVRAVRAPELRVRDGDGEDGFAGGLFAS